MSMETVTLRTMVEVIYGVHLSSYVDSPFKDRGGLMLVGPPAVFKSALLNTLDRRYYNSVTLSDVNARSLLDLRNQISQESIRTLVMPELAKLYDRDPRTAANVEGTLRAMAAEGFHAASFEDQRVNRLTARCTVLAALTPEMQSLRFKAWEDSGFNRRFLWSLIMLRDPDVIERAIEEWALIDFDFGPFPPMPNGPIPNLTTKADRTALRMFVKYQPGGNHATQLALLVKVLAVLRWWYERSGRKSDDAMRTLGEFAQSLAKGGALLDVPEPGIVLRRNGQRKSAKAKRGK